MRVQIPGRQSRQVQRMKGVERAACTDDRHHERDADRGALCQGSRVLVLVNRGNSGACQA